LDTSINLIYLSEFLGVDSVLNVEFLLVFSALLIFVYLVYRCLIKVRKNGKNEVPVDDNFTKMMKTTLLITLSLVTAIKTEQLDCSIGDINQ